MLFTLIASDGEERGANAIAAKNFELAFVMVPAGADAGKASDDEKRV